MEFKRLITQFTYRIEPKPEGGFVAYPSEANMPPLEAPTREELRQKIQARIMQGLGAQFQGLSASGNQEVKFNFHIEHKPGGGFAFHSGEPEALPVEGSQEQIESHFAEKLIGLAEKFSPELRQALKAQGASGDIKVFVDQKTLTLKSGVQSPGAALPLSGSLPAQDAKVGDSGAGSGDSYASNAMRNALSNAPINPDRSDRWTVFLFALTVLVVIALVYFMFHRS